jgi:hypothetical protein
MLGWWTEPNESGGKPLLARFFSRASGHPTRNLPRYPGATHVLGYR